MHIFNDLRKAYPVRAELMAAVSEALTEEELINPATDKFYMTHSSGGLDMLPLPALQKVLAFAPTFYANRQAEAAAAATAQAQADADPAAKKLAELETLIGEGFTVSATALADARAAATAEQDIKVLAEKGVKARAAAAKAAAKTRAQGITDAAQTLPQRPDGLDDAIATAKAAIDAVRKLTGDHTNELHRVKEILHGAGVEEHPQATGVSATDIMDWENHGHQGAAVTVNGVLYTPIAGRIMGQLARHAAPGIDDPSRQGAYM